MGSEKKDGQIGQHTYTHGRVEGPRVRGGMGD